MKKLFLMLGFMGALWAADMMFQTVEADKATLLQKGNAKEYCPICGMNLVKYYKTSHAVTFKDGTSRQFCSIHCLVDESEMGFLRDKKEKIAQILVTDVDSLKMIDAKKAFYVVGSKIKGTMTGNSKYAFATKAGAETFMAQNGGKITTFDEAYDIALKDFTNDMKMLKAKREEGVYTMGKDVMTKFCDETKVMNIHAHNMGETKQALVDSGACKADLSDMQLQAVTLYYWDIKLANFEKNYGKLVK